MPYLLHISILKKEGAIIGILAIFDLLNQDLNEKYCHIRFRQRD
jgi:hypothetical protein